MRASAKIGRPYSTVLAAASILLACYAGLSLRRSRPWESPIDRAHRLCWEWTMLPPDEVDGLIEAKRASPLTRHEKLQAFRLQFEDPADAELCIPCNEAILDVAEWSGP